jgi:poly(3-hydroxybutyrate) depolymerase
MNKSCEWFENNVIYRVPTNFAGAGRRVYPGFLQHSGFVAMNPSNHAKSHYDYFKDLIKGDDASTEAHRKFYDEYNAVLDMDADYYLETIRVVFQDFSLVNGTWDVRNLDGKLERVRPQDISTTALFSVEGELDDISGSGQTEAVHSICSGVVATEQKHLEVPGAGHYGIFSGRRWRDVVYPQVKAFILKHQPKAEAKVAAAKPAAVAKAPRVKAKSTPVVVQKVAKTVAQAVVKTVTQKAAKTVAKPVKATAAKPVAKKVASQK